MTDVRRGTDRAVTEQPGITTRHSFSAGAYYDPDNLAFGPVVGVDEHVVAPGAGFPPHAHRGVVIVSWVLSGALSHESDDVALTVHTGDELLVQAAGDGIVHRETAAGDEPLRLVQTTLVLDLERSVSRHRPPLRLGDVTVDVVTGPAVVGPGHVFVGGPGGSVAGTPLAVGDTLRLLAPARTDGPGRLLVVGFTRPPA